MLMTMRHDAQSAETHDMRRPCCRSVGRGSEGFTLIEVLIAVLVMSVGLLGIAALQTATVQFNRDAYLRSQATSLAYDIADRMRANRSAALAGSYDVTAANPAPVCGAAAGATVADRDISEWRVALACALPAGNGSIDVENGIATIRVTWDGGVAEELEMETGL